MTVWSAFPTPGRSSLGNGRDWPYDCADRCKPPGETRMQVREGMSEVVLTIGPQHTLRQAAEAMYRRNVGAAVVMDPEEPGPGVITERDVLWAIGRGKDPDQERVCDHLTSDLKFAQPNWSLEEA